MLKCKANRMSSKKLLWIPKIKYYVCWPPCVQKSDPYESTSLGIAAREILTEGSPAPSWASQPGCHKSSIFLPPSFPAFAVVREPLSPETLFLPPLSLHKYTKYIGILRISIYCDKQNARYMAVSVTLAQGCPSLRASHGWHCTGPLHLTDITNRYNRYYYKILQIPVQSIANIPLYNSA